MNTSLLLADLLLPLVRALVLKNDAVRIVSEEKSDTITFTIVVDPSDRGRIIGKQAKTIAALRLILQAIAALHQRNAIIALKEPEEVFSLVI